MFGGALQLSKQIQFAVTTPYRFISMIVNLISLILWSSWPARLTLMLHFGYTRKKIVDPVGMCTPTLYSCNYYNLIRYMVEIEREREVGMKV